MLVGSFWDLAFNNLDPILSLFSLSRIVLHPLPCLLFGIVRGRRLSPWLKAFAKRTPFPLIFLLCPWNFYPMQLWRQLITINESLCVFKGMVIPFPTYFLLMMCYYSLKILPLKQLLLKVFFSEFASKYSLKVNVNKSRAFFYASTRIHERLSQRDFKFLGDKIHHKLNSWEKIFQANQVE